MLINPEKMSRRSHYNYVENQVILSTLLMLFALTATTARQIRPGYDQPPQLSIFTAASFLCPDHGVDRLSLDSIRQILVDLEDTIIFSLIERAKYPLNSPAYAPNNDNSSFPGFRGSLMEFLVRGTEAVQAQGGRYQSPEEVPFFPDHLPPSLIHTQNCSQELPSAAASVSVNKSIWDSYVNHFLPLLASEGNDGNYALSVAADLVCLQALSRRVHYGKFAAEAKFRGATKPYSAAIRAKDRDSIRNLLTDEKVEAIVKQRVKRKSMIFGEEVTLNNTNNSSNFKVDPSLVSHLYDKLVIPLTKDVEVEYLLRRLDN